jgi:hypothetical protein
MWDYCLACSEDKLSLSKAEFRKVLGLLEPTFRWQDLDVEELEYSFDVQVQIVLETFFDKYDHLRHGRVLLDEFAAGFSLFLNGSKSMKLSFSFQVFTEFVGMGRGVGRGRPEQQHRQSKSHANHHRRRRHHRRGGGGGDGGGGGGGGGEEEEGSLSFEDMQRYLRSFILALFNLSFTRKGPCLDVEEAVDRATEGANPER